MWANSSTLDLNAGCGHVMLTLIRSQVPDGPAVQSLHGYSLYGPLLDVGPVEAVVGCVWSEGCGPHNLAVDQDAAFRAVQHRPLYDRRSPTAAPKQLAVHTHTEPQ